MMRDWLRGVVRAVEDGRSPIGLRGASLTVLTLLVLSVVLDWPPLAKPQWAHRAVQRPSSASAPATLEPLAPEAVASTQSSKVPTAAIESAPTIQDDSGPASVVAAVAPSATGSSAPREEPSASARAPVMGPSPPPAAPDVMPESPAPRPAGRAALASPAPAPHPPGAPLPVVAIIIDDLGVNVPATEQALRLPAPVTLSFLPYGHKLGALGRAAHAAGDEVFLHLPMQALGAEDAGPNALVEGLSPEEMRRRVAWALARVPDAVGVNNHMGSRLTADPDAMMRVMADLAGRGMVFIDSLTSARSVAAATARSAGIPAASRDVFLDDDQSEEAIARQLAELERIARTSGTAIAIGHPYPATLAVLDRWIPQARARGLRFATASSVIAIRSCGTSTSALSAACIIPVAGPPSPARARPT